MAHFTDRLIGEVIQNPDGQEKNVELLLVQLLRSLIEEQSGSDTRPKSLFDAPTPATPEAK